MIRQELDDYLDGALDAQRKLDVEKAVSADAHKAALLQEMKAERALRAAAFRSYEPVPTDASAFAAQLMDVCREEEAENALAPTAHAPVGYVGRSWFRVGIGVAAAIAVAVTSYTLGQANAPVRTVTVPVERDVVRVERSLAVVDSKGDVSLYEGDQAAATLNNLMRSNSVNAVAGGPQEPAISESILIPGHM